MMLRDAPRIYMIMFGAVALLTILIIWYGNFFQRGSDTLQINEAVMTSAVSEIDHTSRLYEGALLLKGSFESDVWDRIAGEGSEFPEGTEIQFDYIFDAEDERFDNVESESVSSPTYRIGEDVPSVEASSYMTGRPVQYIRIKVREPGEAITDWTYTSTVALDAASRSGE